MAALPKHLGALQRAESKSLGHHIILAWLCAFCVGVYTRGYTGMMSPSAASLPGVTMEVNRTFVQKNVNEESTAPRVIALCVCRCNEDKGHNKLRICESFSYPWNAALTKMAELVPQISYAGMHELSTDDDSPLSHISCDEHVERWIADRLSSTQQNPANTTTIVERIYTGHCGDETSLPRPLNESLAGQSSNAEHPKWLGGLHSKPSRPRKTHFVRHDRDWGEVWGGHGVRCNPKNDDYWGQIQTYRSRGLKPEQTANCDVVHIPTILRWAEAIRLTRIDSGDMAADETVLDMLTNQRSLEEARQILESKKHFCGLITMTTMQPFYPVDALMRHALCRLLDKQYKPCLRTYSWKNQMGLSDVKTDPRDTHCIQRPFKFIIAMPNELSDGYLVEKTIHPYLAGSLAITASPKVGRYVNAEGLVSCIVPPEDIARVQNYYRGDFMWMPFDTTPEMWAANASIRPEVISPYDKNNTGDEAVLDFVAAQWEEALQPCIDKIIRLDKDDDAYVEKLMQPYLRHQGKRSMFDGTYIAHALLRWYAKADSPLVDGLEDEIERLDGMLEQTPGWGVP